MSCGRAYRPEDERLLLRLAEQPMPGWARVRYSYGAGFLAGESLKGERVAISVVDDEIRGMRGSSTRTTRSVWMDGRIARLGYLSGLRSFPDARRGFALYRGLVQARSQAAADPSVVDFATVLTGNAGVADLLTSGRVGLPRCRREGVLRTCVLSPRKESPGGETATDGELRAFYARESPRVLFFPSFDAPLPPGLRMDDFFVVRREGRIVAAAATWNHGDRRRIYVDGYAPWASLARPLLNLGAAAWGCPRLPAAGEELPCRFLSYALAENDDPAFFAALLSAARTRSGGANLVLAVHERNPLLRVVRRFHPWEYASELLAASFFDEPCAFGGVPHVEAGML